MAGAQSAAFDQYSGVPGPTPRAAAQARRGSGISGGGATVTATQSPPGGAPERLPFTGYPLNRVVLALFSLLVAAVLLRALLIVRTRRTRATA